MLNASSCAKLGFSAWLLLSLTGCKDLLEQVFPKPTPPPTSPDGRPSVREEWVARYNSTVNGEDAARDMAVDAAGNVIVTGTTSSSNGNTRIFQTIKYSPSGQQLWDARYEDANGGVVAALALDAAGNVFITGGSYLTIKYAAATGQQLWEARYAEFGSSNGGSTIDIAVDRIGNVAVTGTNFNCCSGLNDVYLTILYSPTGQQLWATRYNGSSGRERAIAVAMDAAGDVIVTGTSSDGILFEGSYATIKYAAATGQRLWEARYQDNFQGNTATAQAVDAAGNVVVTGTRRRITEGGPIEDITTVKYSSNGQRLWAASYDGPGRGQEFPSAVALDAMGNVVMTATTVEGDYATVKYSTSGQQLWAAHYNGPDNGRDATRALLIDPSGNVVVTGSSAGQGSGFDYATVKYSASGQQLWVARYNGPANEQDAAAALAMDAAGDIVVTGSSAGVVTRLDFATIKYSEKK